MRVGVVLLIVAGCGRSDPGIVLVTPSVVAPPLLESEAQQLAMPVRIEAPLRFENRGTREQTLALGEKGCSCYGVATDELVLEKDQRLTIPAGGVVELFFLGKLADTQGDQAFRAGFQTGTEGAVRELRADCRLQVVPDLTLEPESIVIDLPAGGQKADGASSFAIVVRRATRGLIENPRPPAFTMSPELLRAGEFQRDGTPEEVTSGLWRESWRTGLTAIVWPDDVRENGGRFVFSLEFPEGSEPVVVARPDGHARGKLPLAWDVIESKPERRVSGHLILRRSKGIVFPAQLHFGALPVGTNSRTRRLVLTAADQTPFVVTVENPPAAFAVAVDSDEPAIQQWITVTFTPGEAGEIENDLTLRTTHPLQEEVRIKLKAKVQ